MPILDFFAYLLLIIDRVIVPLIFAIAFVAFVWGVAQAFVLNPADGEARKKGRDFVLYAVIGFFLMVSVWGITRIFVNTFGFDTQVRPPIPTFR